MAVVMQNFSSDGSVGVASAMAVRRRAWPSCAHSDAAVVADALAVSDPLTNASMDPHFANQDAMLDPAVTTPLMPAAPPSPRMGKSAE